MISKIKVWEVFGKHPAPEAVFVIEQSANRYVEKHSQESLRIDEAEIDLSKLKKDQLRRLVERYAEEVQENADSV